MGNGVGPISQIPQPLSFHSVSSTDPRLSELLHEYHKQRITNNEKISQLLEAEGITLRYNTLLRLQSFFS